MYVHKGVSKKALHIQQIQQSPLKLGHRLLATSVFFVTCELMFPS
jgi:hypothetical protein